MARLVRDPYSNDYLYLTEEDIDVLQLAKELILNGVTVKLVKKAEIMLSANGVSVPYKIDPVVPKDHILINGELFRLTNHRMI